MNNIHEHARKRGLVRPSYPVPRVAKSIPPSAVFLKLETGPTKSGPKHWLERMLPGPWHPDEQQNQFDYISWNLLSKYLASSYWNIIGFDQYPSTRYHII